MKDPKKTPKQSGPKYKPGEKVHHALNNEQVKIIRVCKTRGITAYMVEDKRHIFRAVEYELTPIQKRAR